MVIVNVRKTQAYTKFPLKRSMFLILFLFFLLWLWLWLWLWLSSSSVPDVIIAAAVDVNAKGLEHAGHWIVFAQKDGKGTIAIH